MDPDAIKCVVFVQRVYLLEFGIPVGPCRAANNGRSTDNVRSKIGFVRSNPWMAGQFVRSFTLVRKKIRVSSFKYLKVQYFYYRCLSGQKWDNYVRAKIGLTGQFDRRQPGNYLQP